MKKYFNLSVEDTPENRELVSRLKARAYIARLTFSEYLIRLLKEKEEKEE